MKYFGSLAFGSNPLGIAVCESLVLPDRHGILDFIDDLVTRIKCLCARGAGDSDDDRDFANLQITNTMCR